MALTQVFAKQKLILCRNRYLKWRRDKNKLEVTDNEINTDSGNAGNVDVANLRLL